MRFAWANVALLVLLVSQLVTGLVGLLGTSDPFRVIFWLHAVGAYGIVFLLFAKGTIVYHALRRRPGLTQERIALAVLVCLLLAVLVSGFVWITAGSRYVLGISLINVHAYLALLLVTLLAWHVVERRWIVRVPAARDRAAFLRIAGVAVAGVVLWQTERAVQRLLDTAGSRRRFTGSYERGSFTGIFPAVSWINDDPDEIDPATWRLVVDGQVARPLELTHKELGTMLDSTLVATVDCTGGWYSTQEWRGVSLARLLDSAGATGSAKSVSVESVTGYARRFSLGDARGLTLATHVAGRPLTHGHGFPARLVVPDQRGFDWVKWVRRIEVLDSSQLLQPPLPLA
jgi:DMSO/TMAO reductase YedYZ molybdopterin-dependent catalytic subunit